MPSPDDSPNPVPASETPRLHRVPANGISMACWEWRAERRGEQPTMLLVHATGFHGRVWDQLVRHLPGRHVLAVDQRGHGLSEAADFDRWEVFGRDLSALVAGFGLQGAVGVGHSMGAVGLLRAAVLQPGRLRQLVLIDPVVRAPEEYLAEPPGGLELHPAAQRKNRFASADEMFRRFADRPPYAVFDRQALRDYCVHGLRPAADGQGFELACAPAFEGKVYPLARVNPGLHGDIRSLDMPVLVLRARPQDPAVLPWDPLGTPTWDALAAAFPRGRDLQLMDKTHMLPMEDPALVARLIDEAMRDADALVGGAGA